MHISIKSIFKWSKIAAKFAAIGTAVSGAVTATTFSAVGTGVTMGIVGSSSYAAMKVIHVQGYDRIPHVPPVPIMKTAGRSVEIDESARLERDVRTLSVHPDPMPSIARPPVPTRPRSLARRR